MKRFLTTILLVTTIPLILLVGLYIWTDPFKCIHSFDINDIDDVNREYLSMELFLRNEPEYNYNSFVFSSSRGVGINTYTWKMYLPEGAQPYLFQAWAETITGIEQKIQYLSEHDVPMDNVLILLDIPGSFENHVYTNALSLNHYKLTGESKFVYNVMQFYNFIQKPSIMLRKTKRKFMGYRMAYFSDTISNDYDSENRYLYEELPSQDSLKICSETTRRAFLEQIEYMPTEVIYSKQLIDEDSKEKLLRIHEMLLKNYSDYYIILTPAYCYTNPAVNMEDKEILQEIFGVDRVKDYTGKNAYTEDYNNFKDPNHFGLRIGYLMLRDIYGSKE